MLATVENQISRHILDQTIREGNIMAEGNQINTTSRKPESMSEGLSQADQTIRNYFQNGLSKGSNDTSNHQNNQSRELSGETIGLEAALK